MSFSTWPEGKLGIPGSGINTCMSGELGRGRAAIVAKILLRPAITGTPMEIKMAVTTQGMGDPPLRQATTPISRSTTNHAIKLAVEGMGLSTKLAQTIGVITQDQSCSCCKVIVVCRSKGQGAGCNRTITEVTASVIKPITQRLSAALRRVCTTRAACGFETAARVVSSNDCLPGRSGVLS